MRLRSARSERIGEPLDGNTVIRIPIHADDVETRAMALIERGRGQEHCCRFRDLDLLASIDRECCARKTVRSAVTNFDKDETLACEHDQIDFADTAAKISTDRFQAMTSKESECELFRVVS